MAGKDNLDTAFIVFAFFMQGVLLVFFVLRLWNFDFAVRIGWPVYTLGIPAAILSLVLLFGGKSWEYWLGGFLLLAWGILGYTVDIARPVAWRSPIHWPIFLSYVGLYLSAQGFYWFPVGILERRLWFIYGGMFVVSTILNMASHR